MTRPSDRRAGRVADRLVLEPTKAFLALLKPPDIVAHDVRSLLGRPLWRAGEGDSDQAGS